MKELAEVAGVSVSTVSRVLNGKELDRIPRETREKVLKIALELGYQPNSLARSLREKKTRTIGLLISGLQNPFFVSVLEAAERHAIQAGYQVLLAGSPSVRGSYYAHAPIHSWPVDGVVMWADAWEDASLALTGRMSQTPIVYLGSYQNESKDSVTFDMYHAMRQMVAYLVERGYRSTCYVSAYNFELRPDDEPRVRAYFDACRELECEPRFYVMEDKEETKTAGLATGLAIAAMPAAERPRALICHNDVIAVGIYHGVLRAGLRVPEDIAISGFDGIEDGRCLDKPLTTMVTSPDALCQSAVGLLVERITGKRVEPARLVKPAILSIGGTT